MFVKYKSKFFLQHILSYSVLLLVDEKYTFLYLVRSSENMLYHAITKGPLGEALFMKWNLPLAHALI